jgi:oligopeptide transport system substrate-binding protein
MLIVLGGAMYWSGTGRVKRADFTFINRGDIGTLDPNRMSWMQDIRIGYALWEGLYALDPQTLEPVLGAADRVDMSPDRTQYTFHLRDDGRWSDGSLVTSDDFIFAWSRMLQEPGDYTYLLYYIKGAEEYQKAFADYADQRAAAYDRWDAAVRDARQKHLPDPPEPNVQPPSIPEGITASADKRTLRVELKHPVAYFPDVCAFPPMFPLDEKSMDKQLDDDAQQALRRTGRRTYDARFTRPPNLISNGPYFLQSWEFKKTLVLRKNPYYWDRQHVRSETIEQVNADDPEWAFLEYDSGAVDWMAEVTGEIAAELKAKGRGDLRVFPGFGTYFYSVNCLPNLPDGQRNPLADARVRLALAMSLDKKAVIDTITRMGEKPADTYVPPGIFKDYSSPPGIRDDVAAAQKLLADAGYPAGKGFPKLTILFNKESQHGDIAQVVRRQWEQNLGVSFDLEGVEIKLFRTKLHSKNYAIARASWFGDYNDVSTFTDKYKSDSENNDSGWVNARYDALLHDAEYDSNPDPTHRLATLAQAEQILCEEAPIIPVYFYNSAYLFRDDVKGIPLNPRMMLNFKSVYVEKK